MQQRGLLAEGHGVDGGQYAHRRTDAEAVGAAEQQGGEGDGRRAGPVRYEVVLGQPHRVEPRLLGDLGGAYRAVQGLP